MNLPTFINKWIIGFKPIKYSSFWFWFRLINHDDWRMDDHIRYWDFWNSINMGYLDTNYKWEFQKYWGKGAKPEKIVLPANDFDALVERLNQKPKFNQRLFDLMSKKAPWDIE